MDPYYRDTMQYSPSYVTQAETVQYVSNGWYTEPQYFHDTHAPQNSPITSPQDCASTNRQEVMINQGMNYYGHDDQIQEEWLPECQGLWVPVEQALYTQQVPVPNFGNFNQQGTYAEHPYQVEWALSEMPQLQAPLQIINDNGPVSNQPNAMWIPVAGPEVPCAPYHVQPNQHYNNYGTPYGPETQIPQHHCTLAVPLFEDRFHQQTTFHYGTVSQQDAFEQQTQTMSFETSKQQYHATDYLPCHMQALYQQMYAPVTETTEASIEQEQQQQHPVNYVQPDQNNYIQQQQQILYFITPGPPCQPEITIQQYDTYIHLSEVGQYYQPCDTVSNPSCYPHYEEPQTLVANTTISHQSYDHPYYPHTQDIQSCGPNDNASVSNAFQSVSNPPMNDKPPTGISYETAMNGECTQQCQVQVVAPQFYDEGEQQNTLASHEVMMEQHYIVQSTCSNQENQVQSLQANTESNDYYYHQQNSMEFIPVHGHFSFDQTKPVSHYEGQNMQYVNMYEHHFDPNVQGQYVFVSSCGQYQEHYQPYRHMEYGQFCEQGQMVTTVVSHGIPTQQYRIAFDSQCNGQAQRMTSEEQVRLEHQKQNENSCLPPPCCSTTSDHQQIIPQYQFKSQENYTSMDPSREPFARNQLAILDTGKNIQDQYLEETWQVLTLPPEHNPPKKTQETSSFEDAWSGAEKPNINDITFTEETRESTDLKHEKNKLDLNPPPSMTKEGKMIYGITDITDIEKDTYDR